MIAEPRESPTSRIIDYHRPPLVKYQLDSVFCSDRYSWIEGTTKSGKTYSCMAWLMEQALFGARRSYFWVAPIYSQAKIAYDRLKRGIPEPLRKTNDSDMIIRLPNDHDINFKSAEKPDNLYGDDIGAVVLDEASRMREEAWWAVRSTLTKTKGPLRAIGNVNGNKNWFYRQCRKAEAGETGHHYAKLTADDAVANKILDAAEIEDAKRVLPEKVFKELYYAIPNEDGSNPFGYDHIKNCLAPLSERLAVVYGVDVAKSVDYNVVIGIDALGCVCSLDRWTGVPWKETIERICRGIGKTKAVIDSTGVGDPIVEEIQRNGFGNVEGFKFTSESKQNIMEGLAVSIQSGRIHFPDGPIRLELESFEFKYSNRRVAYEAAEGCYDDCVCALALAVSGFRAGAMRPAAALSGRTPGAGGPAPWQIQL